MNEWEDRWVDGALQELHGSRPPDLSARVVLALAEATPGALPVLATAPRRRAVRPAAAAAALVLTGVLAGAFAARLGSPAADRAGGDPSIAGPVVQIDLRVHAGAIECIEREASGVRRSEHAAGTTALFVARAGNRLRSAARCRFQVGPFGQLATGPATEVEVRSMSVSWKHGVVAASSLTVAVVAGVVTWHTLTAGGTARAGEVVHLDSAAAPAPVAPSASELEQLRQRVQQLEQQNADLQLQLARAPAPPPAPAPEANEPEAPPAPEPAVAGAVFTDDRYADALAALDWKVMGEVTNEMGPMLVDLAKALEEGGELPLELVAKIQERNAKLVAQVPALMKSGLPGSGPNGAYTHPLVAANILAKTLDAAGLAMDSAQRAKIAGLVRMFSVEAQSVADSVQEFDVQRLAAEIDTKNRFYREVATMLTPEQQRVMFPEGARRYDGTSLFDASLFTRAYVDPVSASNATEFARSVSDTYGRRLGLDEQASGQIRAIVERMAAAAPELWQEPANRVERDLHMLRSGRVGPAMSRQVEMMREILRQVPMTPEQRQRFVAMQQVFVPLPQ